MSHDPRRRDELRERLAAIDPAGHSTEPDDAVLGPQARDLLERVMSTPAADPTPRPAGPTSGPTAGPTSGPTTGPTRDPRRSPHRPRRRTALLVAAGLATAAVLGAGAVASVGLLDQTSDRPDRNSVAAPVALRLTPVDPLTQACPMFDPAVLAAMPVAFRGTVVRLTPGAAQAAGSVEMTVNRWYRGGGSAGIVTVQVPAGYSAALDGVELTPGKTYLISARDGQVGSCGLSGEATPELSALFDQSFR